MQDQIKKKDQVFCSCVFIGKAEAYLERQEHVYGSENHFADTIEEVVTGSQLLKHHTNMY